VDSIATSKTNSFKLDPVKIAATKTKTPRPAYRAFVPTTSGKAETDAEREERLYQQGFDTAEWKATDEVKRTYVLRRPSSSQRRFQRSA